MFPYIKSVLSSELKLKTVVFLFSVIYIEEVINVLNNIVVPTIKNPCLIFSSKKSMKKYIHRLKKSIRNNSSWKYILKMTDILWRRSNIPDNFTILQ